MMQLSGLLALLTPALGQELPSEAPSARVHASAGIVDLRLGAGVGAAGSRRLGPVGLHGSAEVFLVTNTEVVDPLVKLNVGFSWPFPMPNRIGFFGPFLALDTISFEDDGENCEFGEGCKYYEYFMIGPILTAVAPSAGMACRWEELGPSGSAVELGIGVQGYMIGDLGLIHPTLLFAYRAGEHWRIQLSAERFAALLQVGRQF